MDKKKGKTGKALGKKDMKKTKGGYIEQDNLMEQEGLTNEIVSPRDSASGLPTGKRQHKPFTLS